MNSIRNLLAINMLYTFIVSALSVMVPLYLLEQKVDITMIGLILSIGPLSFMVIRISLASVADSIGTRKIAVLYSLSNLAALALYTLVVSPLGFALATLSEGVRASGFWAVTRTEVLKANGSHEPGKALAYFSNMRQLADGAGRLSVGFILAYLAFTGAFTLLFVLSTLLFLVIYGTEKESPGPLHFGKDNLRRIFKKRPPTFWYSAFLQAFVWLAYNSLMGFLLPVYFISSLGFSYQETGLLIALLSLATAVSAIALMRLDLPKRSILLLCLLSVPALAYFPFAGKDIIIPLLLLAIGNGCGNIIGEYILVDQVYRSRDVSTDIGVLYAPLKISEFLFLSLGGLAISAYGYAPLFIVLALSIASFVFYGRAVINPAPTT